MFSGVVRLFLFLLGSICRPYVNNPCRNVRQFIYFQLHNGLELVIISLMTFAYLTNHRETFRVPTYKKSKQANNIANFLLLSFYVFQQFSNVSLNPAKFFYSLPASSIFFLISACCPYKKKLLISISTMIASSINQRNFGRD